MGFSCASGLEEMRDSLEEALGLKERSGFCGALKAS